MKHIRLLIVLVALFLASCEGFLDRSDTKSEPVSTTSQVQNLPDSIMRQLEQQNSLTLQVAQKVDSVTNEQRVQIARLDEIQSKVREIETKKTWPLVAVVISLVSLIIGVWLWYNMSEISNKQNKDGDLIGNINKQLSQKVPDNNNGYNSEKQEIKRLKSEIESLKKEVKDLKSKQHEERTSQTARSTNPTASILNTAQPASRKVYAKIIDKDERLISEVDSREEEAIFEITTTDEKVGEFSVIDLSFIRNFNNWEFAVNVKGEVPKSEAKGFQTEHNGRCVKTSGKVWKVEEQGKTTIKLT